jgi:hypothetical protein
MLVLIISVGIFGGPGKGEGWTASHYVLVALYATATRPLHAYAILHEACKIIMPLLASERVTFLAHPLVQAATNAIFPWRT